MSWRGVETPPLATVDNAPSAPSRMLKMGPVMDGLVTSKTVGNVTVKMEATRVWFKKTKTFGFSNALFKKIVAKDFRLTIIKDGKKHIVISKNQLEMPPDQNVIEIKNPRLLFPTDMKQPDSIRFDSGEMALYFRTGNDEEVWIFENM
jgi:hypothetical protein